LALSLDRDAHAETLPALIVTRSSGASDCPDAEALAREVARMNGRPSLDPSGTTTANTRLHVEINRAADAYTAVIRAHGDRTGERHLSDTGPGCESLADALALTLAMVLDNHAHRASIEPEPPRTRAWQAPRAAEPAASSLSAVELDAATGVHVGMLARAGPFVLARGRLWFGDVAALEAGGLYAFEQTVDHERSSGRLDLDLLSGFAGACAALASPRGPVDLALCAEAHLGRLRGTGSGFSSDRPPQSHLWVAGGLAIDVAGKIAGPLFWNARGAAFAVRNQRFIVVIDGADDAIFDASPAGLSAGVGLRLHFE
jgi:hypothetical protein